MKSLVALATLLISMQAHADNVVIGEGHSLPTTLTISADPDAASGQLEAANIAGDDHVVTVETPIFHVVGGADYKLDGGSDVGGLVCAFALPGSRVISQQTASFAWGFWREQTFHAEMTETGVNGALARSSSYLTQVVCGK